jgi:ribonucleoside-diphosphate reductase alpha chain
MDSFATVTSIALQYGVPLNDLVNKFSHVRFEPQGFTGNQEIPIAKSIVDYIFRWLGARFLDAPQRESLGIKATEAAGLGVTDRSPSFMTVAAAPDTRSVDVASGFFAFNGNGNGHHDEADDTPVTLGAMAMFQQQMDAPSCMDCGSIMVRNGSCYKCLQCGSTSGCS